MSNSVLTKTQADALKPKPATKPKPIAPKATTKPIVTRSGKTWEKNEAYKRRVAKTQTQTPRTEP